MGPRQDRLIVRELGAETVVYDLRTHRAHCLGPTAAAVWRASDGRSGPGETAYRVSEALGEPLDEASVRLVWRRLRGAGLIEKPDRRSDSDGQPPPAPARRAAMRRLGVAAGLAVLSIAVRSPAQVAATCVPKGEPCRRSSECCSSCCNTHSGKCSGGSQCAPP